MTDTALIAQLKRHEGYKAKVYRDTEGFLTVGYGYNLDANPLRLSDALVYSVIQDGVGEVAAGRWLAQCVAAVETALPDRMPVFRKLSRPRQDVLVNMAYNMGLPKLLEFRNTLRLLDAGDYDDAAMEMLDSQWAKQVKTRAIELSLQMALGRYITL